MPLRNANLISPPAFKFAIKSDDQRRTSSEKYYDSRVIQFTFSGAEEVNPCSRNPLRSKVL